MKQLLRRKLHGVFWSEKQCEALCKYDACLSKFDSRWNPAFQEAFVSGMLLTPLLSLYQLRSQAIWEHGIMEHPVYRGWVFFPFSIAPGGQLPVALPDAPCPGSPPCAAGRPREREPRCGPCCTSRRRRAALLPLAAGQRCSGPAARAPWGFAPHPGAVRAGGEAGMRWPRGLCGGPLLFAAGKVLGGSSAGSWGGRARLGCLVLLSWSEPRHHAAPRCQASTPPFLKKTPNFTFNNTNLSVSLQGPSMKVADKLGHQILNSAAVNLEWKKHQ